MHLGIGLLAALSGCAWVSDQEVRDKVAVGAAEPDTDTTGDDTGVDGDDTADPVDDTGGCEPVTWYADADGDGVGTADTTEDACDQPSGFVGSDGDCDDTDADVFPGATDACGDGVDADCGGEVDDCALAGTVDIDAAAQLVLEGSIGERAATDLTETGDLDGDGVVELAVASKAASDFAGTMWVLDPAVPRGTPRRAAVSDVSWGSVTGGTDENLGEFIGVVGPLEVGGAGGVWASARDETAQDGVWRVYADPPISGSLTQHAELRLDYPGVHEYPGQAAASGDVNGDGVADLLLKSGLHETTVDGAGAWLLLGPISGNVDVRAEAGFELVLDPGLHSLYFAEGGVLCDVDGDGLDEAAIGSPSHGDDEDGIVYYLDAPPTDGRVLARADLDRFEGSSTWEKLGLEVRCGNLDGDGYADLVMEAELASDALVVAVASGASIVADGPGDLFDGPLVVAGSSEPQLVDQPGTVTVLQDSNGDGQDELAVAWHWASTDTTNDTGWLAVFDGAFDGRTTLDDARAVMTGRDEDHELGEHIRGVPDVDGDGTGEFMVLSRERYTGDEGWMYLFMGGR